MKRIERQMNKSIQKEDFSPVLAALLLAIVLGGLYFFESGSELIEMKNHTLGLLSLFGFSFLVALGLSIFFNLSVVLTTVGRLVGYKKQGSRLRSIKGMRKIVGNWPRAFMSLAVSGLIVSGAMWLGLLIDDEVLSKIHSPHLRICSELFVFLNLWCSGVILSYWIIGVGSWLGQQFGALSEIPEFPRTKDEIALGTLNEGADPQLEKKSNGLRFQSAPFTAVS